ncbi:restriction endonuclease [Rhizosaccharibacter radicis]|uniref:Restriction endonuclease n=1 Tax=Rhizosaccharibacter radicis TaxID=2782605 RepID=A0ABT1VYI3_9PROT|nr:restriction endonuclease [Acetobacteraceae bacterium KSS12]
MPRLAWLLVLALLLAALLPSRRRLARGTARWLRRPLGSLPSPLRRALKREAPAWRRRRRQMLGGRNGMRDWHRERARIATDLLSAMPEAAAGRRSRAPGQRTLEREIERLARPSWRWRSVRLSPRRFRASMSPAQYERFCATELRRGGWDAEATGASGDQGADVIATRRRRTLVLQCKLYGQPVGNRAVQEVHAARSHRRADLAAVVSNAGYTRSALALARSTGVMLLHHDDLRRMDEVLRGASR